MLEISADYRLDFRIAGVEVLVLRAPVEVPVRTSFGIMHDRPAVFVVVEDSDGHRGVGEVWCNFPGCGAEHRANLVRTAIGPALVGASFESPAACFDALEGRFRRLAIQSGEPGPIAQCIAGIDAAAWDLVARRAGQPLYRFLGGKDDDIEVYASGINPTGAADTVARCREEGYRAFKLKIGFGAAVDRANIEAISRELRAGEAFMVDANQAWTTDEAVAACQMLNGFQLAWIEEPVPADTGLEGWRKVAAASKAPLAAGENLRGDDALRSAIEGEWLGVLQPDLCKWGGFSRCVPIARAAVTAGKRFCPHYLGGGVGLAASAHFLAAVGGGGLLEVDSNTNPLREGIYAPVISAGRMRLSDAPGIGLEIESVYALADRPGVQRMQAD